MLNFKRVNIAIVCFLIVFIFLKVQFSYWYLLPVIIVWLLFTTLGSFNIGWNYFLKSNNHNYKVDENIIALTFDDGPHIDFTPKVLALLKEFNAKATFFLIGKNAKMYPDLVKQIIAEGHNIGSHSYAHTNNYGFLSRNKVVSDLLQTQKILFDITNIKIDFFRPPFGVTNPNIARAIKDLNLITFGWSVRSYDTIAKNSEKVLKKITSNLKKGDIVLMHDTKQLSVEVLQKLLTHLEVEKMKSVNLVQLFNNKPYDS